MGSETSLPVKCCIRVSGEPLDHPAGRQLASESSSPQYRVAAPELTPGGTSEAGTSRLGTEYSPLPGLVLHVWNANCKDDAYPWVAPQRTIFVNDRHQCFQRL